MFGIPSIDRSAVVPLITEILSLLIASENVVVPTVAVWFCVLVSNAVSLKSVSIVFVKKLTKIGSLTPNDVSPVPPNDI